MAKKSEAALTDREKTYSIISRVGQSRHIADSMTDGEAAELAAIYDECEKAEELLAGKMADFWGRRAERLAAQKATDDVQPGGSQ